jgi:hypothetical protein
MAIVKHKTHTLREKSHRNGPALAPLLAPIEETPAAGEEKGDACTRFTFSVWLLAFAFLGSLLLWDLVTALLFR